MCKDTLKDDLLGGLVRLIFQLADHSYRARLAASQFYKMDKRVTNLDSNLICIIVDAKILV